LVKLRITGLPADIQKALDLLNDSAIILSVSPYYRNRSSKYMRIYVNAELKNRINDNPKD
jgi:hypothetical protein